MNTTRQDGESENESGPPAQSSADRVPLVWRISAVHTIEVRDEFSPRWFDESSPERDDSV